MTKSDKRLLAGLALVVILVLLLLPRKAGATVTNNEAGPVFNVDIPGVNLPNREPFNLVLPSATPYDFSMVSGCGCGGSTVPVYSDPGQLNYTFNNNSVQMLNIATPPTQPNDNPFSWIGER